MTPSNSTISLPLRRQETHGLPPTQTMVSAPHYRPLYQMHPAASSHTLTSDVASETSTLAQSYREPELADSIPIDYNLWSQQQLAFQAGGHPSYPYGFDYSMADDASIDYSLSNPDTRESINSSNGLKVCSKHSRSWVRFSVFNC